MNEAEGRLWTVHLALILTRTEGRLCTVHQSSTNPNPNPIPNPNVSGRCIRVPSAVLGARERPQP